MVLKKGMALTGAGLLTGIAGAVIMSRAASRVLVTIDAGEPAVFAAGSLLLAVVTLLATYVPARRATKVDPVDALRTQ
jgi:ABC-type antimicrobial peptide transport system permease subunit